MLWLICMWLNNVVEPKLLSCLAIHQNTLEPDACQLAILATGRSQAASFTRALYISCLDWPTDPEAEACMKQYLGLAISSLVKLRSVRYVLPVYQLMDISSMHVRWIASSSNPQWAQDAIMDVMTSLPLLQTLQLLMTYLSFSTLQLNCLSGSKRIVISVVSHTPNEWRSLHSPPNPIGLCSDTRWCDPESSEWTTKQTNPRIIVRRFGKESWCKPLSDS